MTSIAQPAPRRLDAFAVASEPGNERLAISRVAETASSAGISAGRLERLKTAVAEATMNAIEHGNKNQAEIPVDVEIIQTGDEITVAISDQGGAPDPGSGGRCGGAGPGQEAGGRAAPARLGAVPHPQHGRRDGSHNRWPAAHRVADHANQRT